MNPEIQEILAHLQELKEDVGSNKKIKEKTDQVITTLNSGSELAIDKALHILDEFNQLSLSSYHRTQVWDIVSLLESAKQ